MVGYIRKLYGGFRSCLEETSGEFTYVIQFASNPRGAVATGTLLRGWPPMHVHLVRISMRLFPILIICMLFIYSLPAVAQEHIVASQKATGVLGDESVSLASGSQPTVESFDRTLSLSAGSSSVLNVIRWNARMPEAAGRVVRVRFSLFQEQTGGVPIWSEDQSIEVGADGHYSVLLGAASPEAIPPALFQTGDAKWIEVQLIDTESASRSDERSLNEQGSEQIARPRSLLAAVPYALKSLDAETLAGRAAGDYVTQEDLKSALDQNLQLAANAASIRPTAHPVSSSNNGGTSGSGGTSSTSGTPGSGAITAISGMTGSIPFWTSPTNLGNSAIVQSGANVGIGTLTPATTLDVNGTSTLRGPLNGLSANFSGPVVAGAVSLPSSAPAGTLGANSMYVPGVIVPITAFGAKCDWNGSTGTDDTAAWNAAWAAIHKYPSGGMITMPACYSYAPNGLNFSTNVPNYQASYTIRGQGMNSSVIVTKNAPVGLDLGGVNNVHLEDFELTDVGTSAKVGIARYRVAMYGGNFGGGTHTYRDVEVFGAYSIADLYSLESENNDHYNLALWQTGAGAGFTMSSDNCANLTGQGQAIAPATSDTVNHFFGGIIGTMGNATGGAVLFCNGSADDVSFSGTYFVSYAGYNVRFGQSPADMVQGTKSFHSVRFEGTTDAISFICDEADSLTIDSGSTFGEVAPGIDLNWIGPAPTHGFMHADIHGNTHLGRGIVIPVIMNSRIQATSLYNVPFPITTITVSGGISESELEANAFSLGTLTYVSGSTLIQNDDNVAYGSRKIIYGPNPGSPYSQAGSTIVMRPFQSAPTNPTLGELAVADGIFWQPNGVTSPTLVLWNGTSWVVASR